MREGVIRGAEDLTAGTAALVALEPRFGDALALTGPWPLRLRDGGYPALVNMICSQQVSVASAAAIAGRVEAAGFFEADAVLTASDEALRVCGLSRPKARYLRALAEAGLDYDALAAMPTDEIVRVMTAVPGIGVWTAEIYALFSLGRADAFPAGDLALQEGARMLFDLPERPKPAALRTLAEPWAPWRGVAARGLWAYYALQKRREGVR